MLPKNLAYGSKVESASARSYRTNIQPQNGTGNYNAGETIIINIPTRNNLVYVPCESYLKFTHTVTAGAADSAYARFDSCGAHGLIQRIRVFHGSNLLSDIDNYGLLSKLLFDLQVPTDSAYGKYNILAGTRSDLTLKFPTLTNAEVIATPPLWSAMVLPVLQSNSGARMNATAKIATTASVSQTYCLNLITLAGSLCKDKYFPLFACTSAPLRVEIQLVPALINGMCIETASTFQISNCEYIAQMIELSDNAMNIIRESQNGQPLQFVNPDYRNFQYTFALANAATTQVTMPIPAKFSSLKSLFITARDSANVPKLTYFPYSSNRFGISQYFFRVGAQVLPSKVPDTIPEMFAEAIKAIGSMGDLNHQPSIEYESYNQNIPGANSGDAAVATTAAFYTTSATNSGSFYVGLDLENYANADKAAIFSGWNSNTDDIYFVGSFAPPASVTVRFDAFALFDTVVVFENGTAYVKY